MSYRTFCYNGLLSVIVLVTKTHFSLRGEFTKEWMNEPLDESKKWLVPLMTLMKRWPYWRFHQTVKKTENIPQAKHVVFRYRVYQTVDIVVTIEKLDLLPPKI